MMYFIYIIIKILLFFFILFYNSRVAFDYFHSPFFFKVFFLMHLFFNDDIHHPIKIHLDQIKKKFLF